ncbi:MAG: DUF1801 domain-containing protein [Flavobacteriales bacterium]
MMRNKPTDIDAYIAEFTPTTRSLLEQIRATIRKASPAAVETISYAIPCFKLNGTFLVYFAGYKEHVGVYPLPKGDAKLQKAMAPYIAGKGTLRFPLDEKLPLTLIASVVKQHALENTGRANAKRKKA